MAEYIDKVEIGAKIQASYIRREAAYGDTHDFTRGMRKALKFIQDMPAADVQPVKRGRWIDIHEYCKMNGYIPSGVAVYYWCSECMKEQEKISDFCPCCGADMREPKAIKG